MKINNKAFTLVELLVVILIIGILAAIAVPQYQKAIMKSRYATLKNMVRSIANAQQVYYLTNGNYTQNFKDLDIVLPQNYNSESTDNRYNYDWGYCTLYINGNGTLTVTCVKDIIHMMYSISMATNKSSCWVIGTNDNIVSSYKLQQDICMQETGRSTPNGKGTSYINGERYQRYEYPYAQ